MFQFGHVMKFEGHGAFSPDGRVAMSDYQIEQHNLKLTCAELMHWSTAPDYFAPAYDSGNGDITLFAGDVIGRVVRRTIVRNNIGTLEALTIRGTNGAYYHCRKSRDLSQLCRLRRSKSHFWR